MGNLEILRDTIKSYQPIINRHKASDLEKDNFETFLNCLDYSISEAKCRVVFKGIDNRAAFFKRLYKKNGQIKRYIDQSLSTQKGYDTLFCADALFVLGSKANMFIDKNQGEATNCLGLYSIDDIREEHLNTFLANCLILL